MSNQEQSPQPPALNGFNLFGPVNQAWMAWLASNKERLAPTPEAELALKYCFYCAAVHSYNELINAMRADKNMQTFVMVSSNMKLDFDMYFIKNQPGH